MTLGQSSGVHLLKGMLFYEGARNALITGDKQRALSLISEFGNSIPELDTFDHAAFNTVAAVWALFCGKIQQASDHADLALNYAQEVGVPYAEAHSLLLKSLTLHAQGHTTQALEWLQQASQQYERSAVSYMAFEIMLCKSILLIESNQNEEGLACLAKAFAIGQGANYRTPYLFVIPWLTKLALIGLENGIEIDYVNSLIDNCHLIPKSPPIELEHWPWPIRIYSLGSFKIVKKDGLLTVAAKSQQKPLELLKVLISFGARNVAVSEITDILWPNAEGDHSYTSFSTTLHRLRNLLGVDNLLLLTGNQLSLNEQYCWLDIWAMNALLDRLKSCSLSNTYNIEEVVRVGKRILSLCQGIFLQGHTESYVLFHREKISNSFQQAIIFVGKCLQKTEQWQSAAEFYQKALEIEPFSEEFIRNLMLCYRKLNRNTDALIAYTKWEGLLRTTLNIVPNKDIVKFATSFIEH